MSTDSDGDGVDNAADNCPMVWNELQFDEDGDARGDECDPCPQLAAAADDQDDDGDRVGNGCDPRPTVTGDVLAYWSGFHTPSATVPAGMSILHGSASRWSVADGQLVFTRSGEDWGIPVVDVGNVNHSVDSTFQITASYQAVTALAAGVVVDAAANDNDLSDCQARTDTARREIWQWDGRVGAGWTNLKSVTAPTPNDTYRIVLRRTALALECTTTRAGQAPIGLVDSFARRQHTRAGVFARNVDVKFRYIAVYTSP